MTRRPRSCSMSLSPSSTPPTTCKFRGGCAGFHEGYDMVETLFSTLFGCQREEEEVDHTIHTRCYSSAYAQSCSSTTNNNRHRRRPSPLRQDPEIAQRAAHEASMPKRSPSQETAASAGIIVQPPEIRRLAAPTDVQRSSSLGFLFHRDSSFEAALRRRQETKKLYTSF